MLKELGAEVENKSGNRVGVRLKQHSAAFGMPQHDMPKDEVSQLKKFLIDCGVDPNQYPL